MRFESAPPLRQGTLSYLGRVNKFVKYSQKLYVDYDFVQFVEPLGFQVGKSKYGIARGSWFAGKKAFMKYDREELPYDQKAYVNAVQIVMQSYSVVKKSGFSEDFMQMFEWGTSAGYPWSLKYSSKRKALQDHEVKIYVENFVRNDTSMLCIASNSCKREPKKIEKILNDDIRVIMALPLECTAKGYFLFADQNENINNAARIGQISSTVGLSKFSLGWHSLYKRLSKHPNVMELDFSNFDGSIDYLNLEMVMNLRYFLYVSDLQNEETLLHLQHYYTNVLDTVCVLEGGSLFMKHTGNPSGQVNTISDNSIVNEFRWIYAWCLLVPQEYRTLSAFKQNVELIVCGDDSLLSVSDLIKDFFNPELILPIFRDMNWKPKFSSESFITLSEAQFCSLKFLKLTNGIVVPYPANRDKILTSMAIGAHASGVRASLQRALAIRVDVFFDSYLFKIFDGYVNKLFSQYYLLLKSTPKVDEPAYDDLLAMNKSSNEILSMYIHPPSLA